MRRFHLIAALYDLFFRRQWTTYAELLGTQLHRFMLPPEASILDIGSGTGAFAMAFKQAGFRVHAVDGAPAMAARTRRHGISCDVGDATERLGYADGSFDMVTGAFLLHGLKVNFRIKILREAARISAGPVLWHDFAPIPPEKFRPGFIDLLERLEGSDYRGFTRTGLIEMRQVFQEVEVLPISERNAWYICRQ